MASPRHRASGCGVERTRGCEAVGVGKQCCKEKHRQTNDLQPPRPCLSLRSLFHHGKARVDTAFCSVTRGHLPRHQCSHRQEDCFLEFLRWFPALLRARPCCPRPRCRSAPNRRALSEAPVPALLALLAQAARKPAWCWARVGCRLRKCFR